MARRGKTSTPEAKERGWRPPRFGGDLRVALAFPGGYRAGMSSLGFQTILHGFASLPGVTAARVFLLEEAAGLSLLDAGFEPAAADLLAFSVAYENDYGNVLAILARAGLPLRAADRGPAHPAVLVGGIAPTLNPEPLAPFADAIALGEGEELLAPFVTALREARGDRRALQERWAGIPGLYVPALYQPRYAPDGTLAEFRPSPGAPPAVPRAVVADLDAWPTLSRILAPGAGLEDLCLVEVNRGCGRGCRFCAAGHLFRPLRHRSAEALRAALAEGAALSPRFGLLGAAVADHPDLVPLARGIVEGGGGFSLSSLRLDRLPEELLGLLVAGGTRTATFAPETGSERLRRAIGKRIGDAQILEAAASAAAAGVGHLKLYFMVGLPTETGEDRAAIPALVRKIRHETLAGRRVRQRLVRLSVGISCFVPKAWTPFQWHPFAGVRPLKDALGGLVRELRRIPNTDVTHDLPKWAHIQALLSRGDRRAGDLLELAHRRGDWGRAMSESPVNPEFFVSRPRGRDELFPWDFIQTGLRKDLLWEQYRRALAEEPAPAEGDAGS